MFRFLKRLSRATFSPGGQNVVRERRWIVGASDRTTEPNRSWKLSRIPNGFLPLPQTSVDFVVFIHNVVWLSIIIRHHNQKPFSHVVWNETCFLFELGEFVLHFLFVSFVFSLRASTVCYRLHLDVEKRTIFLKKPPDVLRSVVSQRLWCAATGAT